MPPGSARLDVDKGDPSLHTVAVSVQNDLAGGDFEIERLIVDGMTPKEKLPLKVGKIRGGEHKKVKFHFAGPVEHARWSCKVDVTWQDKHGYSHHWSFASP